MGPEASPRLRVIIKGVGILNEGNLTHYNCIHGEVFPCQSRHVVRESDIAMLEIVGSFFWVNFPRELPV